MPFPAWCNMSPRRQCLPGVGIGYTWAVAQAQLQPAAQGAAKGVPAWVYAAAQEGASAARASFMSAGGQDGIVAGGLAWQVAVKPAGKGTPQLSLRPVLPAAYQAEGSCLAPGGSHHGLPLPVGLAGRMSLTCRRGRNVEDGEFTVDFGPSDAMTLNRPCRVTVDPMNPAPAPAADPLAP
ncbi:hypothetical protein HYH03_010934 [Edaphochlamys debaryana]|uniref:Uncharacterized protein n=1 Tax=Edaphochlamys debaryana TaxID=47281 RepID=A0A836BVK2_9CHLO|nr:hypothetical protein HYH03_010934 [Edaphochlamys debaryana]|eukprot:KAG2490540.1 hypothetical protein HYH03_010934 [Edaphochlamys debaryana]